MLLDLLYEIDVPKPWGKPHPYGQREAEQRAYREAIEQIKLADTLGFNCTWHVEHHFREGRSHSPAPEVIIGALSQCTENLRLGFGVTLMPHAFTPPMRVAEKVATADILSNGRVEWGTGRSTPMEQTAFHVPRDESRDQWEEAIRAVVQMWEDEYFEFHGKYLDFPRRMVTPKPVQDPHPPCWMAATSDGSAAVAGKLGLGLLSFSILQPLDRMSQHIAQYRDAAANPDPITRVTTNKVAAYTLVHCADTMAQCEANGIWDSVWWWYKNLAEFTLEWEFPNIPEEERDQIFPLLKRQIEGNFEAQEFSDADMIIVGDPEHCLQKMLHYADLGVDQLICYVQFGHLEHETIMRTIELLGTEIIPELAAARRRRQRFGEGDMTRTDDTPVPDYPGLLRLDGKRFVVLGAGQGIGRQASHALASVGARLAVVDVDPDLASDIAEEVDGIGLSGDAFDRAHVELLFADATAKLGGIDGVVDIIGMARYSNITEMTDEEWDWHFDIVLRHAFLAMQYGGRALAASGGGAMVFVASVSGITSGAAPLGVRRGQGRAHVAGAHRRGRNGAVGHPGQRGRAGCGVDPARLRLPRRGRPRAQHRQHAAAPHRATGRHRGRDPVPGV